MTNPRSRRQDLAALLGRRILVLDGAAATMLSAPAGGQTSEFGVDGLVLGAPQAVADLHRAYLAAGADILKTNSFNATRIADAELAQADLAEADVAEADVAELNRAAAALARQAADEATAADPARPRFVAGVLGPTPYSVGAPAGARHVDARTLTAAYAAAARGLLAGGADLILVETVCDSANATAALRAVRVVADTRGEAIPVMVSATVDVNGRLPSGETLAAFWQAVAPARPLAVGLNCAFGAAALAPQVRTLAALAAVPISVHPNAGLPDSGGAHPDGPAAFAAALAALARDGIVDIVGGCCGTTPAHIAALAAAVRELRPRHANINPRELRHDA